VSLDVEPGTVEECNAMLPPGLAVHEGQFCTSSLEGSDVCTGLRNIVQANSEVGSN
jgi:hypothetical protein